MFWRSVRFLGKGGSILLAMRCFRSKILAIGTGHSDQKPHRYRIKEFRASGLEDECDRSCLTGFIGLGEFPIMWSDLGLKNEMDADRQSVWHTLCQDNMYWPRASLLILSSMPANKPLLQRLGVEEGKRVNAHPISNQTSPLIWIRNSSYPTMDNTVA